MKNKWFVGLGVLLVFWFVLVGCDTGTGDTGNGSDVNLQGQWKSDTSGIVVIVFGDTIFSEYRDGVPLRKATFTAAFEDFPDYLGRIVMPWQQTHQWNSGTSQWVADTSASGTAYLYFEHDYTHFSSAWTIGNEKNYEKGNWITEP
jgi:hypothetical protein